MSRPIRSKVYPLVRNLLGDEGENRTMLSVAAVLSESPHYPEQARIIAGNPTAPPGEYLAPIGGFSCDPEGAMQIADVFERAARDVDTELDKETPPITTATGTERTPRWIRGARYLMRGRCEVCSGPIRPGDRIQTFDFMCPMVFDDDGQVISSHLAQTYVHADPCHEREELAPAPSRPHLINGEFQSDKYPTCPSGKVPLSCGDPMAQDLLWEYAQRRRVVDAEFTKDLEEALRLKSYVPRTWYRFPLESDAGAALAALLRTLEREAMGGIISDELRPLLSLIPKLLDERAMPPAEPALKSNTGLFGSMGHQVDPAAEPWTPQPIPALWFDKKGRGPDHMFLRLNPVAEDRIGDRSIPPSLGIIVDCGDLVIVGAPMLGGGFNMERPQVADLHRQLGAWLADRPVKRP